MRPITYILDKPGSHAATKTALRLERARVRRLVAALRECASFQCSWKVSNKSGSCASCAAREALIAEGFKP